MHSIKLKYRKSVYVLEFVMLYLIVCEIAYAQESRILSRTFRLGEIFLLVFLFMYYVLKSKGKIKKIGLIFIALIFSNLIACLITYMKFAIFIEGTYDYLKYVPLMLFVMECDYNKEEITKILRTLSVVVIICSFFAVLQFIGLRWAFDIFRGRFGIYAREGFYRAIGIFAYPIELGNFSCVMFALTYQMNKILKKKYYTLICGMLLVDTLISGSRVPFVCCLVIIILSNFNKFKNRLRALLLIVIVLLFASNFIDANTTQQRLEVYLYGETPRVYYIEKGLEIWADNPLFGIGFETYGTKKFRDDTNDFIFDKYDAHYWDWAELGSTDVFYSQILPEFGIVGVSCIIAFVYLILKAQKRKKKLGHYASYLIYVPVACLLLCANSSSALFSPHVGSFVWLTFGIILGNGAD